jgi:hypothetical protein
MEIGTVVRSIHDCEFSFIKLLIPFTARYSRSSHTTIGDFAQKALISESLKKNAQSF